MGPETAQVEPGFPAYAGAVGLMYGTSRDLIAMPQGLTGATRPDGRARDPWFNASRTAGGGPVTGMRLLPEKGTPPSLMGPFSRSSSERSMWEEGGTCVQPDMSPDSCPLHIPIRVLSQRGDTTLARAAADWLDDQGLASGDILQALGYDDQPTAEEGDTLPTPAAGDPGSTDGGQ